MKMILTLSCLLVASAFMTGCVDASVDVSRYGNDRAASQTPPPNPDADPRTTSQLVRDNAKLRQQLAELERNYNDWKTAVDRKKDENDRLKDQRDDVKKQRDRAKKALEHDD